MKGLLIAGAMLVASSVAASANNQILTCGQLKAVAMVAMDQRQSGEHLLRTVDMIMDAIGDPEAERLIMGVVAIAYDEPRARTHEGKMHAVMKFSDMVEYACFKQQQE